MKKLLSVLLTLFIVFMSFNLILAEDYTYTSVQMSIRKDEKTIKNNLQCYLLTDTATNNNYQMYIPFEDFIESLGYEFKWVDIYYDYNGEQEEWTKYDGYIIINNTKYYFCYCNLYQDEINGNIDIYTYKNGELIDVNLDLYKSGGTILINDKIYIRQEAIAWLLQYEGYLTQIDLDNNCINIKSYDINNLIQQLKTKISDIYITNNKYLDIYEIISNTRNLDSFYKRDGEKITTFPTILYPQKIDETIAIELFKRKFYDYWSNISDIKCNYDSSNDWYIITAKNTNKNANSQNSEMIVRKSDGAVL